MTGTLYYWPLDLLVMIFKASISVLGGPLNKLEPCLPGIIESSDLANTFRPATKEATFTILGNSIGQKGAEGQLGTTRVPRADVFKICLITLGEEGTTS